MSSKKRIIIMVSMVVVVSLVAGCSQQGVVVSGQSTLPAEEGSPGFLDRVSSQMEVSENDAMRGLILLLDGEDTAETFNDRVQLLRKKNIIAPEWSCDANKPVSRGKLAYMIYQACKPPPSVTLAVTGPSRRYCHSELIYQKFMTDGSEFSNVSGVEYIAVISRADAFIQDGKIPAELGGDGG